MWTLLLLLSLSLRKKEVRDEESGQKLWFKTSEPGALSLTQNLIYHRAQNRTQRETAVPQTHPDGPTPRSREPRQQCPDLTVKQASMETQWGHPASGTHSEPIVSLLCFEEEVLALAAGSPWTLQQLHRREEPTSCFLSGSRKSHFTESFGGLSLMI